MRTLLALLLCSCAARTTIYENGQKVATIYSDATNVSFRTANGTTFGAAALDNATPIKAYGGEISSAVGALGTAAAVAGTVLKP